MIIQQRQYPGPRASDYGVEQVAPHQALLPYIDSYTVLRYAPGLNRSPWHIMPDCAAHLLVHFHDGEGPGSSGESANWISRVRFIGPRSVHTEVDKNKRRMTFLVKFRPYAAAQFVNVALDRFVDVTVGIDDLWPEASRSDMQCVEAEYMDAQSIAYVFDKLLLMQLRPAQPASGLQPLFSEVAKMSGGMRVTDMASTLGVSTRHLRNLFKKYNGLSPKRFLRIVRVTHAIHAMDTGWSKGWAQLAYGMGYCDQAHLINECQTLLGERPEAFIQRKFREDVSLGSSVFSKITVSSPPYHA